MSPSRRALPVLLVAAGLAWLPEAPAAAPPLSLTLSRLETNAASQPLGIDDRAPRFTWALVSARRGVMQAAYRVLVASTPGLRREGMADVWDSGRIESSDPWSVYAGLVFGQLQTDYYVASGSGDEVWAPRFSYKGFEYVQLSGPGGGPLPGSVSVTVERIQQVRSALVRTSSFEAGQGTLDRIHGNTTWAVQSNMHGIVTDTPVYEKNGWTGDAQLMAGSASLLFDTERLYSKMSQDMLDARPSRGKCHSCRRATGTTATSASPPSSRPIAAAPLPPGTRSGS